MLLGTTCHGVSVRWRETLRSLSCLAGKISEKLVALPRKNLPTSGLGRGAPLSLSPSAGTPLKIFRGGGGRSLCF